MARSRRYRTLLPLTKGLEPPSSGIELTETVRRRTNQQNVWLGLPCRVLRKLPLAFRDSQQEDAALIPASKPSPWKPGFWARLPLTQVAALIGVILCQSITSIFFAPRFQLLYSCKILGTARAVDRFHANTRRSLPGTVANILVLASYHKLGAGLP